jgi:DNA-binding transcriptional MerR regulator
MMSANTKKLTIGKLAELGGVSADTLRYYEKFGLIKADSRSSSGYRYYTEDAVSVVRFIKGAKSLNFTLEEIRQLLALNSSDQATCAQIIDKTEDKIAEAEARILELKEIKKILKELVQHCPGGNAPVNICPILDHIQGRKRK